MRAKFVKYVRDTFPTQFGDALIDLYDKGYISPVVKKGVVTNFRHTGLIAGASTGEAKCIPMPSVRAS